MPKLSASTARPLPHSLNPTLLEAHSPPGSSAQPAATMSSYRRHRPAPTRAKGRPMPATTTTERDFFVNALMSSAVDAINDYSADHDSGIASPLANHVARLEGHTMILRSIHGGEAEEVRIDRAQFGEAMTDWAHAIALLPMFCTPAVAAEAQIIICRDWGLVDGVRESTALLIAEHAHTNVTLQAG